MFQRKNERVEPYSSCGSESRDWRLWSHLLALLLGAVAVDGSRREAGARQEVLQRVGAALRLHEHQGQALRSRLTLFTHCAFMLLTRHWKTRNSPMVEEAKDQRTKPCSARTMQHP